MSFCMTLCGFTGRISRGLFVVGLAGVAAVAAASGLIVSTVAPLILPRGFVPMAQVLWVLTVGTATGWMVVALAVKRLHDTGAAGPAVVPALVLPLGGLALHAAVGGALAVKLVLLALLADGIARLFVLAGDVGVNAYGDDPLGSSRAVYGETA